jgi:hypothetical protein
MHILRNDGQKKIFVRTANTDICQENISYRSTMYRGTHVPNSMRRINRRRRRGRTVREANTNRLVDI